MGCKSRLKPWYILIPSNPNLYSTKIIMKMRWRTIASNISIHTISPTATPLPKAYDCVAVYIAGRHTNLVVYGCRPKPATKNTNVSRRLPNLYLRVTIGGQPDHGPVDWPYGLTSSHRPRGLTGVNRSGHKLFKFLEQNDYIWGVFWFELNQMIKRCN